MSPMSTLVCFHNRPIRLNLELVRKPEHCLEYVIVHELVHLLEGSHNDRFGVLLSKYIPNRSSYKTELNRFPLSRPDWEL